MLMMCVCGQAHNVQPDPRRKIFGDSAITTAGFERDHGPRGAAAPEQLDSFHNMNDFRCNNDIEL